MRVNTEALKTKMAEKHITQCGLAQMLGIDNSTIIRKMNCDGMTFTVGQMHRMVDILGLSRDEAVDIFLN